MRAVLWIVLITFIPGLELRASIPWGIFRENMTWLPVFLLALGANITLGVVLYPLMDLVMKVMQRLPLVQRLWLRHVERTRKKIHAGVDKYGEWAIAVFIGIPLPGTGIYTGALAAYLIGLPFRKFLVATILGVLIAGVLVTLICVSGNEILLRCFTKPVESN